MGYAGKSERCNHIPGAAMKSAELIIRRLESTPDAAWDNYVASHPAGGPMHWSAWRNILTDAFAVQPIFLSASDEGGHIRGIAPLYFSASMLEGRHLATLQDGILADDADVAERLLGMAMEEASARRADILILRGGVKPHTPSDGSLTVVHTVIDTSKPSEELFAGLKQRVRGNVRQCKGADFIESCASSGDISRFYQVFADNQHQLGTPAPDVEFFHAIFRHLQNRAKLFTVMRGNTMVGGMIVIRSAIGWCSLYVATDKEELNGKAGYFLYWNVIEWMSHHGAAVFDLGRSTPGSGVHAFKRKWGGRDVEALFSYFGSKSQEKIAATMRARAGFTLKQRLWRAMPASLCGIIGPIIRRQLPLG